MSLAADIDRAIGSLPGPLRAPASRWYSRLCEEHGEPPVSVLPDLTRVIASSEFAAGVLMRDWAVLGDRLETFYEPVDAAALGEFADTLGRSEVAKADAMSMLRKQRNRLLVHILWRDLVGGTAVSETLEALSHLADELLRGATNYAARQMLERFGRLRDEHDEPVPMVILGMGKLGGRELNFSSDIDLIFTYRCDGISDGPKALHAQQYFGRLAREVISLLDPVTADGFAFRIDTRLRPFGDSGPPVVSFAALEDYLLKHGRDWERYAYIKARIVGPRPAQDVKRELFGDMILPFVYRRYLDFGVFESLRDMHAMVAAEVTRRELQQNVKLGPGGIREIEFIVQSLQLLRGGSRPELQTPSLQTVLPLLVDKKGINQEAADALASAYGFLRKVENCIQAIRDKQTHDLPDDRDDQARLCLAMGSPEWSALAAEIDRQRAVVSHYFDEIAFRGEAGSDDQVLRQRIGELWDASGGVDEWCGLLDSQGFEESTAIADHIIAFRDLPATRNVDSIAAKRLRAFIPRLVALSRDCRRPARAVSRSLAVIQNVLRRSAYLALLNENRLAAEKLVRLCERSAYITEQLARFPVLLDELLDPRLLTGVVTKSDLSADLRAELEKHRPDTQEPDIEQHMSHLARFQRASMFRTAVADFSGKLPIMKVSDSLTFLAETILEDALSVAWQDLSAKHGLPRYELDGNRHTAGLGVIAYGKLGGLELSYGSDLDIVFLHDSRGNAQFTDGLRPLDNTMFFARLVRRLVHFLTTQTSTGALYEIDTRLRPSGRKGLLVISSDAFERYQDENAWTWEHQALLRARAVAGSSTLAAEFARIRDETLTRRVRQDSLREDVLSMRARMRAELDRSNEDRFDLKQGKGGIGDIEFLVQYLVLRHAAEEPAVIEFTDNIRQLDALAACGVVSRATAGRLQDIYRGYRLRQHHLVLNGEAPLVAAAEFSADSAAVIRIWEQVLGS